MLHQDVKNRGYLAKTKTCQTLDAHVNTFSFFVSSANAINEDYKWSRENRDSAAALTQTVWLSVHIKTLVCVITKQTNKPFLGQGSRVMPELSPPRGLQSCWGKLQCLHCIHKCLYWFNSGDQFFVNHAEQIWTECRTKTLRQTHNRSIFLKIYIYFKIRILHSIFFV